MTVLTDRPGGQDELVGDRRSLSPWVASRQAMRPPSWRRRYLRFVVAADGAGVLAGAIVAAMVTKTGPSAHVQDTHTQLPYVWVSVIFAALWLLTLTLGRVFTSRVIGSGPDEFRRILNGIVCLLAGVTALAFFAHLALSRSYVAAVAPFALCWTLAVHWVARQRLHRRRRSGNCQQAAVLVGSSRHVTDLARHLRKHAHIGLDVVGACTDEEPGDLDIDGHPLPVVASSDALVKWIKQHAARAVVVADAAVLGPAALRRFAWQLEGLGVDLIVAPSVTGVAGPRVAVRLVEGLPLLHLEEPRFDGVTRLLKGLVERCSALLLLLALSPMLAVIALAIKVTSRGPVLYAQTRVGRDGKTFRMVKFRSMVDGADRRRDDLLVSNDHGDDPLFKMRRDPRVTAIGRVLRRLSLDEVPQLFHVVTGQMAVVGPRPPLPEEVRRYDAEAWRRLLVRPGLTGLWQVSGRSTLPWVETLRLDLHYVDNWSPALDLVIVLKTFNAVLRGRGAY